MEKEPKKLLSGMNIEKVWIEYESIIAQDNEGNKYYFNPTDLIEMFNKRCFTAETKKTRTWIIPI